MAILGDSTAISMNVLNTVEAGTIKKRGGTSSQFLMADGSVSTHSGVDKVGTVTSVAASAGAGISVSGSPITTSGTLSITNTGVRSVTAGSTANIIKVNTNGTDTNITINNVAHATSADSATKATQDGNGNTITSKYVTLDTAQTITGAKTFSGGITMSSNITPNTTNTRNIGSSSVKFANVYATTFNGVATNISTEAATSNSSRAVFFAYEGDTSRVVYDNDFKYNPSTNTLSIGTGTLTATQYSGNAATATKATQDGNGNTITSKYVTLDTAQEISGAKTFNSNVTISGSYGIKFANNQLSESTGGRLSVGTSEQAAAQGFNAGNLLISNTWADYTKVPTDGIYCKGQIVSANSFKLVNGTASQFLMADGTTKTLSTTVSQNNTNPVTSGAVWSFCDEFEEVTATALNYLNLSKQDKLTAGSGIALTQASGSAIISVAGVPREVLSATHAGLVQLRNNNRLVPGQWYRITDYNPTFVGSSAFLHSGALVSGHHRFDILVMATSYNTLAPDAYACRHEGDTYFQHCLLDKWKLKYSLTDPYEDLGLTGIKKYTWCDAATDGGIIYEMIDENNNQCPYDFKNVMIQVYCRINAGKYDDLYQETDFGALYYGISSQNQKYYTFNLRSEDSDNIDLSVAVMDPSWGYSTGSAGSSFIDIDIVCNNTIKPFLSRLVDFYPSETITSLGNTNPGVCQRLNEIVIDYQWDGDSSDTAIIRNNVFDNGCHSMFYLPGACWTTFFSNNYFGKNCHDIIFTSTNTNEATAVGNINIGNECNNIIINSSELISIGDDSCKILIGEGHNITVGRNCHNMSLPEQFLASDGSSCYQCYFGDECSYIGFEDALSMRHNVFGCSCNNITLDNQSANNTFGDYCSYLSLTRAFGNRFGNYCNYITCPTLTRYNTFGDYCNHISVRTSPLATYGPSDRSFDYCTFDSNTCYLHLVASTGNVQRKHVLCSASGTSVSSVMNFTISTYATPATTADMYIGRLSNGATALTERSPIY